MARPLKKKDDIEKAAIKLFATKGLARTVIKDIAREAEVTEGALYRHYTGKDEMAWKLFNKSKTKEEETKEPEESKIEEEIEEIEETEEVSEEPEEEDTDKPLAEYSETLETGKPTSTKSGTSASGDQRVWRDVKGIEGEVDNLHITRAQKPITDLDKRVDKLIQKRKKK